MVCIWHTVWPAEKWLPLGTDTCGPIALRQCCTLATLQTDLSDPDSAAMLHYIRLLYPLPVSKNVTVLLTTDINTDIMRYARLLTKIDAQQFIAFTHRPQFGSVSKLNKFLFAIMKLNNPVIENSLLEVSLPEYHAAPINNTKLHI